MLSTFEVLKLVFDLAVAGDELAQRGDDDLRVFVVLRQRLLLAQPRDLEFGRPHQLIHPHHARLRREM